MAILAVIEHISEGTLFFRMTPKGVLDQGSESLTETDRNYLRENFAPL